MGIGEQRSDYPGFECPICGHRRYYRILVWSERQTEASEHAQEALFGTRGAADR